MSTTQTKWTNFSKGELSPLIEGRPDLAAYFEGAALLENWQILRQGGVRRRPGLRKIVEVKDSSKDTILLPFEPSISASYVLEVGDGYVRFVKDKAQITSAGTPVEVASPYLEAELRYIHFTQSVDVMYLFHKDRQQRKLSRLSDTSWVLASVTFDPPPTFEEDTDVSGGTITLTPAATTGDNILFTASAGAFLQGDIGRQIISGTARASIRSVGPSSGAAGLQTIARADILDAFASTSPIAAGSWKLRLSPQSTIDPNKREPIGSVVTITSTVDTFRAADVGKYISVYGGLVEITNYDNAKQVRGRIATTLSLAAASDPAATAGGTWALEIPAWSTTAGWPRTGEFYQGRLAQASTALLPTTFWLSASDDYENFGIGPIADRAIEYTIAARQLNQIEWLADNLDLFIGTAGAEMRVKGGREGEPLTGDVPPLVERLTTEGSCPIQPIVISRRTLFMDRSQKKVFSVNYNLEEDGFDAIELTAIAEHIAGDDGFRLGAIAFQRRPDPRLYFVRTDGELVTLTFYHHEKIIGFTRFVTDGEFQSVACIPSSGGPDQIYVVVRRTINGQTKRFIELFEDNASEFTGNRSWKSLQTDCAMVYSGVATATITGLSYLEGETVDVIADGEYIGERVVTAGQITLDDAASVVEVGLHYDSDGETMRPAIEGRNLEGIPRAWDRIYIRLHETLGGTVNDQRIEYAVGTLGTATLYTGDKEITDLGWNADARISFKQTLPYPMTVLAIFGDITFGA